MKVIIIILIILLVIALSFRLVVWESLRENRNVRVTRYEVRLPKKKAKKNYRICFVSDFHEAEEGRLNSLIINLIRENSPDIILIGGDMINRSNSKGMDPAIDLLNDLSDIAPCYFANGNHELKAREMEDEYPGVYKEFLAKLPKDIRYLNNETAVIDELNTAVTGLDVSTEFYKRGRKIPMTEDYLRGLTGNLDDSRINILLAHNPDYFPEYKCLSPDIVFSGHFHGGLVRLPLLGGMIGTRLNLFPKYDYGMFDEDGSRLIVTNGLGSHTLKLRINNIPEIVFIDMLQEDNNE